jgi:hypothetical protein
VRLLTPYLFRNSTAVACDTHLLLVLRLQLLSDRNCKRKDLRYCVSHRTQDMSSDETSTMKPAAHFEVLISVISFFNS